MVSIANSSMPSTNATASSAEQKKFSPNHPYPAELMRLALRFWGDAEHGQSDEICYVLLARADVPKTIRGWASLLVALNLRSPIVLAYAKDAVKLLREATEVGNTIHQRQLELAENVLELAEMDIAEYANQNKGIENGDEVDWKNVRTLGIWAVLEALRPRLADQLASQFFSSEEATTWDN